MPGYSRLERALVKQLDRFPQVRGTARDLYRRANFLVFRQRGFRCTLHPGVVLTPALPAEGAAYFFGYYDKSPWSPDGRALLMHRHRGGSRVEIVVRWVEDDAIDADRVVEVGTTPAWNYQQGAMAQWLPGPAPRLVYNDCVDDVLGAWIVAPDGGERRWVPWPVQTLHPAGHEALSLNYRRLARLRPEYGYDVPATNFAPDAAPADDGLWRVDLATGSAELVASLDALKASRPRPEMDGADHKVNHALYAPDGSAFLFLHRWIGPQGKFSRLYVTGAGGRTELLLDDRMVSHCCWFDNERIFVWARTAEEGDRYYLIHSRTGDREVVGAGTLDRYGDGHPSRSPDGRWLVTDTYPDRARKRHLLLYDTRTGRVVEAGAFLAPLRFDGALRCDLHPRWSPDGTRLSIDSAHEGRRASYVLDVHAIVQAP